MLPNVKEFYAELSAPLLKDVVMAKELTLNLASRYSKYNTFGNTTNSKLGFVWKPLDQLMLRGTVAEGFRAHQPSLTCTAAARKRSPFFTDPCDTLFGGSAQNATRGNCTNGVGGNGALGALAATYRQRSQTGLAGSPNTQTPIAFVSGSTHCCNRKRQDQNPWARYESAVG